MESRKYYNVYCDESCHLRNDQRKVFVLGAVWAAKDEIQQISKELRELKSRHGLDSHKFESKWTKISKGKSEYYCDLVKYFFENEALHFRAVIVPDKSILNHDAFGQDHDTWYYKMFYLLLHHIVSSEDNTSAFNVYLDIKDTKSNAKVIELKRILNIASGENQAEVSASQQIRSHEAELMQLTDLLIGALSYVHRSLTANEGKKSVIGVIKEKVGERGLMFSSPKDEDKFNILVWRPNSSL